MRRAATERVGRVAESVRVRLGQRVLLLGRWSGLAESNQEAEDDDGALDASGWLVFSLCVWSVGCVDRQLTYLEHFDWDYVGVVIAGADLQSWLLVGLLELELE